MGILRKKGVSVILPQKTYSFSLLGQSPSGRPYTSPTAVVGRFIYLFFEGHWEEPGPAFFFFGEGGGEDISPSSTFSPQDETIRVWLEKDLSLFISQPALGKLREPCLHFGVWVEELACCGFLFLAIPKGPGRICAIKWFGSLD